MTITRARKNRPPQAENAEATPSAQRFIEAAPHVEEPSAAKPVGAMDTGAAAAPEDPSSQPATEVAGSTSRQSRALTIVRRHLPWAAAAGALPIPAVDLAAIIGVQLRMLSEVGAEYGVPFKREAARTIAGTLMAAVLESGLAGGAASALKMVPGIGTAVGILALPALAAAGTHALGKVFITHFESGGTFLDFEPARVERHFREEFERSREKPPG